MNVPAYFNRRLQLQKHRLTNKNVSSTDAEHPDLALGEGDGLAGAGTADGEELFYYYVHRVRGGGGRRLDLNGVRGGIDLKVRYRVYVRYCMIISWYITLSLTVSSI